LLGCEHESILISERLAGYERRHAYTSTQLHRQAETVGQRPEQMSVSPAVCCCMPVSMSHWWLQSREKSHEQAKRSLRNEIVPGNRMVHDSAPAARGAKEVEFVIKSRGANR